MTLTDLYVQVQYTLTYRVDTIIDNGLRILVFMDMYV
jgi:hypothetical protein